MKERKRKVERTHVSESESTNVCICVRVQERDDMRLGSFRIAQVRIYIYTNTRFVARRGCVYRVRQRM